MNRGPVANGPHKGRVFQGQGPEYLLGGIGLHLIDLREEPLGALRWVPAKGGFWEWSKREPDCAIEQR